MDIDLKTLSDNKAQQVLAELYELLPGDRPGYDEAAYWLGELRDEAPSEVGAVLGSLDGNDALRGEIARHALAAIAQQPALRPLLDVALKRAGAAHMMALPELIAGVVVVLAVLPSHLEKDPKGGFTVQWNQLQNLAGALQQVGGILKALPKSLLGGRD